MNNKKLWLALSALILVVAVFVGVYFANRPQSQEGAKTVTVIVVHKDDTEKKFTYHTNEEFLGPLLIAEGLIPKVESGMFDTVDGEKADFNVDEGWWGIYKGTEMLNVGINEAVIADGDSFRLEYINGFAS